MAKTGRTLPTTSQIIWEAKERYTIHTDELAHLIEEEPFNVSNWFNNGIWAGGITTFRKLLRAEILTRAEYEEILLLEGHTSLDVPKQFLRDHPDFCILLHALEDESLPKDLREAIGAMTDATVACIRAYRHNQH